ncbi:tripeptidyl peptidase A [Aspergillus eucalypticola CBS 122712]|uniref:tripeptidyl-peptidase II n=1 Tax=Aspergillus eucalypticola (strain CBS 122712 / IBT 29274) TaxID=1448314 RepID=A0A317WB26_ASPEC|nr:tripeptidyl peptidase A [Aspergillus eucalypticola CBS 122712]PWY81320.1 tripeptidyl peptidase A [Aspergillus eucalypticola CBS 122712]
MVAFSRLSAGFALAAPVLGSVVLETIKSVPSDWKLVEAADTSSTISLSVALARQNLDQLEEKLLAVSTPGKDTYGQFLDLDDINEQFPLADDAAVVSWLKENGVTKIHKEGGLLNFATTVGTANQLLNTTFSVYKSGSTQKLRTTKYSVPDDLAGSIDLISPTVFFGKSNAARSAAVRSSQTTKESSSKSSDVCEYITPDCLKEQYSIDYTPEKSSGSRVGFGSFLNESALYSDLDLFTQYFDIPEQSFTIETINGGINNQENDPDGEADLDVENIVGISHPLPVTEYITGGSPPFIPDVETTTDENEPYLQYYEYLLAKTNDELPLVISNSYGDDEDTVPIAYATRVCNLIGLMGTRGISILESSGDSGVGGACMSNDGTDKTEFTPMFPGTCPYITAVGGTQDVPEVAWVDSSGGFSNYFSQPSYQSDQVGTYLDKYISASTKKYYEQYTNFSGRAFPDVSAFAGSPYYLTYIDGELGLVAGTSGASPVFAGVVALLNDARLRANKTSLGFLNPWLYSSGYKSLNDITSGEAVGCQGDVEGAGVIPWASWNATTGWDPATGLGTPNFAKLKEAVLAL